MSGCDGEEVTYPIEPVLEELGIKFNTSKMGNQPIVCEEWRQVPNHPDYEVSNRGGIRSWKNNRWGRRAEPRYLSLRPDHHGYVTVNLEETYYKLHRLVLTVFVGPPPEGRVEGAHRNGNKTDNRVENLYWATPKQNGEDNARLGVSKGERHGGAVLNEDSVRCIRALAEGGGFSQTQIARAFNTQQSTVSQIVHRKAWAHVV